MENNLRERIIRIEDKIDSHTEKENLVWENMAKELKEIKEQTIQTNGSVLSLRLWRSWLTGGLLVIGFLVIPLVVYVFTTQIIQLNQRYDQIILPR